MRIAPEGIPFVISGSLMLVVLIVVAISFRGAWFVAPLVWLPIALWIPLFFRDPDRPGPRGPTLVVAPADGKVVSVVQVQEPDFIEGPATRISIFMNVFNVHVNRYPVDGTVGHRQYRPGKFVNATLDKASIDNEQMSLGITSPRGPVLVRQIAGLIARRIITDHHPGERVTQGQRLGIIRFGSRVDTFLPPDVTVSVAVGSQTLAGQTIIAEWPQ